MRILCSDSPELIDIAQILTEIERQCPSVKLAMIVFPQLDCVLPLSVGKFIDIDLAVDTAKFLCSQLSTFEQFECGNLNHAFYRTNTDISLFLSVLSTDATCLFWIENNDLNASLTEINRIRTEFLLAPSPAI